MDKAAIRQNIEKLVDKYQKLRDSGESKSYSETRTRREFIEQLFGFLGWDMFNAENENEVISEESIENGRPDLTFKLNGRTVMILEAKAFKADLDDLRWAEQAVSYAWNQGVSWAILTDFEAIKIFYAEISPKDIAKNPPIEISYQNYIKDFDFLYGLLSKENVQKGSLDQWAGKVGKAFKRKPVGEKLFEDLTHWRSLLSKAILKNNHVAQEEVDNGVQKILDRLIFIRTAEDRKLENTNPLRGLLNSYESDDKRDLYSTLVKLFKDFDLGYDSTLFADDYSEKWKIDDGALLEVLNGLYQTKDGYRYDFAAISVDVLGSIYQHYLGYVQQKGKTDIKSAESNKRKKQGIFYTPRYIADFIVKETLGELLKNTKPKDISKIKVLDPACGSGSFLTAAYEEFLNYYNKHQKQPDFLSKLDILKKNLYGVDLDGQAVEIAQLNLLLKVLYQRGKLPNLQHNIRSGNSLVSGNEETLKPYFGEKWQEQKPFNWDEEFKEVFDQGGFDVVIGNPPYIDSEEMVKSQPGVREYCADNFKSAKGNWDIYIPFFERGFELLNNKGALAFITPDKWISKPFGAEFRKRSIDNLYAILKTGRRVFESAKVDSIVSIFKKNKCRTLKIFNLKDKEVVFQREVDKKLLGLDFAMDFLFSDHLALLLKMDKIANKTLLFHCENACATSDAYKLKTLIKDLSLDKFDSDNQLKIINTGTIGKYFSKWGNVKMTYLKDKYLYPVVDKYEFQKLFKNSYATKATKSKIIVKGLTLLDACLDVDGNTIPGKSTLIITGNDIEELKLLLAILNSSLMIFYIKEKYPASSYNEGISFTKNMINDFPVPELSKPKQEELRLLVDKILEVTKNKDYLEDVKKQALVSRYTKQIDEKVYKLYGLTEEEIKIVENS